ncbi:hypothetical protein ACQR1Q_08865 [Bradyrhizobium oligotrophicum]|uniref:hypothetical protein n=1 Tax=Bradyrhizobium oligotrophicum TaxID=44255 RepID=UPI003EB9D226
MVTPTQLPKMEWVPIDLAFQAVEQVLGDRAGIIDALNRCRLARRPLGAGWFEDPQEVKDRLTVTLSYPLRLDGAGSPPGEGSGGVVPDLSRPQVEVLNANGELDFSHQYFIAGDDLRAAFPSLSPEPLTKEHAVAVELHRLAREGKLINAKEAALIKTLTARLGFRVSLATLKRAKRVTGLTLKRTPAKKPHRSRKKA